VPANVVTVRPRLLALPTRRNRARARVARPLEGRFHARVDAGGTAEIDFPRRESRRAARERVARAPTQVVPRWRRLSGLHPIETSLRDRGE
jgi:hypothetical protein